MSQFQAAQLYSNQDPNVVNIEVNGTFDECQDIVRTILEDREYAKAHGLGAINSVLWARIVPQIVYYFYGYLRAVERVGEEVVFAVPGGNFGNAYACWVAKKMGLPIMRLIVCTNENDAMDEFLRTGRYAPKPSSETIATSSPSTDISRPASFERCLVDVLGRDGTRVRELAEDLKTKGEFTLTADPALLRGADKVILPGVGEASSAMSQLRERGLDTVIPSLTQPVLGICIGMQLMCLSSEEGDARCMGIFPTQVLRLPATAADGARLKVPHVGWDTITSLRSPLFDETAGETYVYYVHSFAAEPCAATIATTDYGRPFSAALGSGNFFGTQFHPEKSGAAGARILLNFLNL